jgi:hypothetical protein
MHSTSCFESNVGTGLENARWYSVTVEVRAVLDVLSYAAAIAAVLQGSAVLSVRVELDGLNSPTDEPNSSSAAGK